MKKLIKDIASQVTVALILLVANPIVTLLVSKIYLGDWFTLLKSPFFVILSAILLLWLVVSFGVTKVRERNEKKKVGTLMVGFSHAPYGWVDISTIEYADVYWRIRIPKQAYSWEKIDVDEINVKTPPRCPKCETELVGNDKNMFGLFKWICISCGFKKNSKEGFYEAATHVKILAKRQIEIEKDENEVLEKIFE